jgi:hypothetical protein
MVWPGGGRVGQVQSSSSSPFITLKNLSARALSQHWPVRPCESRTWYPAAS